MPLFLDDDARTRNFKGLFKDYLDNPSPTGRARLVPYEDIFVKAGLEVIRQEIQEMCAEIHVTPIEGSPSVRFTAFGSNWIKIFQDLLIEAGEKNPETWYRLVDHACIALKSEDQNIAELAAVVVSGPLFHFAPQLAAELLNVYRTATGSGKKLAFAFAVMKVNLDPEPFEKEIFRRLPPEISRKEIEEQYSILMGKGATPSNAKVVVLDSWFSSFLMQIIILDVGFLGSSWKAVWKDWGREKEI